MKPVIRASILAGLLWTDRGGRQIFWIVAVIGQANCFLQGTSRRRQSDHQVRSNGAGHRQQTLLVSLCRSSPAPCAQARVWAWLARML